VVAAAPEAEEAAGVDSPSRAAAVAWTHTVAGKRPALPLLFVCEC